VLCLHKAIKACKLAFNYFLVHYITFGLGYSLCFLWSSKTQNVLIIISYCGTWIDHGKNKLIFCLKLLYQVTKLLIKVIHGKSIMLTQIVNNNNDTAQKVDQFSEYQILFKTERYKAVPCVYVCLSYLSIKNSFKNVPNMSVTTRTLLKMTYSCP